MPGLAKKVKLLTGICLGDKALTGPFYAMLDLTSRCNLRCHGCKFHSPEAALAGTSPGTIDFPYELVEQLMVDLRTLGTPTLFLLADGEPLLHSHFIDVVRLAGKYGLHTTVTTNGTLIDRPMAERIVASGLDSIHVSLWASSAAMYEKQYPNCAPDNFFRVVDGMKALAEIKAETGVRTPTVSLLNPTDRNNFRDVGRMYEIARQCRCDEIRFTPFKTDRGRYNQYSLTDPEKEELRQMLGDLRKTIEKSSMGHNIDLFMARTTFDRVRQQIPCYAGWFFSRIRVDGTVAHCGRSEVSLGNLANTRFAEIWNGEPYRRERRRLLRRDGRNYVEQVADCEVCSYARDNFKVHRYVKYLLPLLRLRKRPV